MNLVESVVEMNIDRVNESNSPKKDAVAYLKAIQKDLAKAIKEFANDNPQDAGASVVGLMTRVHDQDWYDHYFS